jgi:mannan endo-1,4-beta-mannosidase
MREAQRSLAAFLPLIDWTTFQRQNWNEEIRTGHAAIKAVGCGDLRQALVWVIRTDTIGKDRLLRRDAKPVSTVMELPCLRPGMYRITAWDTLRGRPTSEIMVNNPFMGLRFEAQPVVTDMAFAVRKV